MKILELLEDYETSQKSVKLNRPIGYKKPDYSQNNTGAFSSVHPDKNDPFMVRKSSMPKLDTNYDPDTQDGYWKYIDMLQNNSKLRNNPFFPRVYGVKTIVGENGRKIKRANLEKLETFAEIETDLLAAYANSIVKDDRFKQYVDGEYTGYNNFDLAGTLSYKLESAIERRDYSAIKNDELIAALKAIEHFSRDYVLDLHAANVMFRRGPKGIHLVITDPISFTR